MRTNRLEYFIISDNEPFCFYCENRKGRNSTYISEKKESKYERKGSKRVRRMNEITMLYIRQNSMTPL